MRIKWIEDDNYFGDHKSVGDGLFEMKTNCGVGYRLYYSYKNDILVLLLCGSDKSSQQKDIEKQKNK
jgi:putative addiction module killer protein